jgi:hypothetical protein
MPIDRRHLETGLEIPSEGYCDEPYVVVNEDGSWTCTMTTGRGIEGEGGQHVVCFISPDRGLTWEGPFDIEPASGPEASWVMPLKVPGTGRIYAFYTYNRDNLREVKTVDGGVFARVDSLGVYAYKYSDDNGRTWSKDRHEIPMRRFECDRQNTYGGQVLFFWGVGKPFVHKGAAYVAASKVGGFGEGFFTHNEGVLFRSSNLLTESNPARHVWETLPEGEVGLRTPPGGGPIAGEFNVTPMNDGSLYGTYRTIDGWSCHAYSRDDGRTWDREYMTYTPGGRRVKNPRAANFVRRFSNGKYLYWFHFHGGEVLARAPNLKSWVGYEHRNPVWLCGGVERAGRIHWSQPEIALYDDNPGLRISYPDFIEQDGRIWVTETQKAVARVHEIDPKLLAAVWADPAEARITRDGLLAEHTGGKGTFVMPELPTLYNRGGGQVDASTGATLPGRARAIEARGGLTLELRVNFRTLRPWQVVLDSRDGEGRGMLVQLTDRGALKLSLTGHTYGEPGGRWSCGLCESAWETDRGLFKAGVDHHVVFVVDGGPKIITVLVNGVVCDGGKERQYGWGRFNPYFRDANGAVAGKVAPDWDGEVSLIRIYGRALFAAEAVANFEAIKR